jgi:serine/threonine-protein kinase RsbW
MARKFQMEITDMAYTHALSLVPRTFRSGLFVEVRRSLPSQVAAISPFVDQLMRFITKFRAVDGSEVDIDMALREALANAVIHGNQEDPRKRVSVACRCTTDGEVSITVQDEGQGFERGIVPDPTISENRLLTNGRGIYLMKTLMDEVCFEQGGAVVYMRKKPNRDAS